MTIKDYRLLAGVFKARFDAGFKDAGEVKMFWELAETTANVLNGNYKNFNYDKFINHIDPQED